MAAGMMTRKFRLFLTLLIFSSNVFAATNQTQWVIGAQKFSFTRNQTGSVADGIAVMFPARILEKLSSNMYRNLYKDEKTERELYKLRQEKNSYFLQLSSEIKKRDSLFLDKYSKSELDRKIETQNKKIQEIKTKLDDNLQKQRELEESIAEENVQTLQTLSNPEKKGFFNYKDTESEKVTLYKNDISSLFSATSLAMESGVKSAVFEKEVVNAKINCLITGQITAYDEYLSVTIEAIVYPGRKTVTTITEIGSIDDADFMASNIASALAPAITNSMPVTIQITVSQPASYGMVHAYIDDILYNVTDQSFTIDSGVHFIQFTADGYKNAGTNYYFEGNKNYEINVLLEPLESKTVYIDTKKAFQGQFLINGLPSQVLSDGKSKIEINGNAVLGEFISEDKTSAFLYIPENKLEDGALYTAKIKPLDHSEYIEKYRKKMYLSYSILVTSLVPTIATTGRLKSYTNLFESYLKGGALTGSEDSKMLEDILAESQIWSITSKVFTGISIACGVWFVFELYRYFNAANSVLPATTKINFDYTEPEPAPIAAPDPSAVPEPTAVPEPVEGVEGVEVPANQTQENIITE